MADDNYQNKSSDKNDIESLDEFEINEADITHLYLLSQSQEFDVYSALQASFLLFFSLQEMPPLHSFLLLNYYIRPKKIVQFHSKYKNNAVAVKISSGSAFVDDEKERFTRRVEILKRVNHSNIVKFIGATVVDGNFMIMVFELVENSYDVHQYLTSTMPKPLSFVVTTALLASEAMEYLHSQGIMHGNLYSKNLLMAEHVTKLTGFSKAKEVLVDEKGTKELHKRDIFDFGGLLFELTSSVNDSQKHKIPESLVELMGDCLSIVPEDRPEFILITQNLEVILSTINLVEDLDLDFDDLMSEIPILYEEMCNSRHVADSQVDVLSRVQYKGETSGEASAMSTESMDGETLEEYLLELKPDVPNNKTAIRLALRISEAMQQLHAQGISHRNLKSSHVFFLTKDREFLSLGDLEYREEKTDEMDHGQFKADVYNFSQILWEFLTNNHTPFQAYASLTKEKRPILQCVPNEMVELLMSCGSEKEEERPDFIHITATLTKLLNELLVLKHLRIMMSTTFSLDF